MILLLLALSAVLDPQDVRNLLEGQVGSLLGPAGSDQISTVLEQADQPDLSRGLAAVLGVGALLFRYVPDAEIAWRDVWIGALATALLFTIGKFALGIYLGQSDPGSAFGAAGALALLLVWIYYSAIILFLGAEFTQA